MKLLNLKFFKNTGWSTPVMFTAIIISVSLLSVVIGFILGQFSKPPNTPTLSIQNNIQPTATTQQVKSPTVTQLSENLSLYAGRRFKIKGTISAQQNIGERPCEIGKPCDTLMSVTLSLADLKNPKGILSLFKKATKDNPLFPAVQYEQLECRVLPGDKFDCGQYKDGKVMTLDGEVVKYNEPVGWQSGSTGSPPKPIKFRETHIFVVK